MADTCGTDATRRWPCGSHGRYGSSASRQQHTRTPSGRTEVCDSTTRGRRPMLGLTHFSSRYPNQPPICKLTGRSSVITRLDTTRSCRHLPSYIRPVFFPFLRAYHQARTRTTTMIIRSRSLIVRHLRIAILLFGLCRRAGVLLWRLWRPAMASTQAAGRKRPPAYCLQ